MISITIKELSKLINRSKSVLTRFKGLKNISHGLSKNNDSYKITLLLRANNKDKNTYNLEELKLYTIFSLFVKGKPKCYKKETDKVEKILRYKEEDILLRELIRKNNISITEEELEQKITLNFCIKILKIIYNPIEVEQEYSNEEVFNIKLNEETEKKLIKEENKEKFNYDYKNILDYIFNKYSQKKEGYFPLQHPTGNGKTFFLEKFLVKNILENFENLKHNKIIVITSSKVNVNEIYRNIEKRLIKKGKQEKIKFVFQMKSVADIFSEVNFLEEFIQELDEKLPHNFINNLKRDLKEKYQ